MWRIIRNNSVLIIFATAIVVYGYKTFVLEKPCASPITYKIGTLDPRFGISEAQFIKDLNQASDIWGKPLGKKLFVYDPQGSLTINLVYDSRQQTTQRENVLKSNITETKQTADSAKLQYQMLERQYAQANQIYSSELTQYRQAQDSYNAQVSYWNARGGAPQAEYAKLKAIKESLATQQQTLDTKRSELNSLAAQTNALIDRYNLLVDHINSSVRSINNDGLAGTQFEEGVYVSDAEGKHIDIYQFDNQTTFIRVLAHELGHSLGLMHNSNPESIMNPVNEGKNLTLSSEDRQDLQTLCGV